MFKAWLAPEDPQFASQEAERAYTQRATRILDAIQLRVPDRVPFWLQDHCYFPCRYAGITNQEAIYHMDTWFEINKKTFLDFEPDMFFDPSWVVRTSGQTQEALGTLNMKWPGHGVPHDHPHQFVEKEYMHADEYDEFIHHFEDFNIRTWWPRNYAALEALQTLPPLHLLTGYGRLTSTCEVFARPEIVRAFSALQAAGVEAAKWSAAARAFSKEMNALGFPKFIGSAAPAPFDVISDLYRGMRGSMLDMFRQPDNLLKAMDMLMPRVIEMGIGGAKHSGLPGVFTALHRGSDGFMSSEQFETFYWPYLKQLVLAFINQGLTPCVFFEGDHTSRLKYYAELPKGKVLGFFDATDMHKAKEIIGDTICISGMMPVSLLQIGPAEKIKAYAKKLIDTVGKGGGFIMAPRSVMDYADPKYVKVWADFTIEYGVYV
jgi:hypothetical protein